MYIYMYIYIYVYLSDLSTYLSIYLFIYLSVILKDFLYQLQLCKMCWFQFACYLVTLKIIIRIPNLISKQNHTVLYHLTLDFPVSNQI